MKKLKIIGNFSNVILIFLTLATLLYMINLFVESLKEASDSLQIIDHVFSSSFSIDYESGHTYMDPGDVLELVDHFSGEYIGVPGEEFRIILDTLKWSAKKYLESSSIVEKSALAVSSRNQVTHLEDVYYTIQDRRYRAFDSLFYFLSIGVFAQFIFIVVSYSREFRSQKKLRETRENLAEFQRIREGERRNIASYLHDSILQDLGSFLIHPTVSEDLELRKNLEEVINHLRNLTYNTSPLQLYTMGLRDSIQELIVDFRKRTEHEILIGYKTIGIKELSIDDDALLVCFRFVQEALNNIAKHANAGVVEVRLILSHPFLIISVKDDGVGIPENLQIGDSEEGKHMGLLLMEQQIKSIGAELTIKSDSGEGTTLKMKYNLGRGKENG